MPDHLLYGFIPVSIPFQAGRPYPDGRPGYIITIQIALGKKDYKGFVFEQSKL